LVPVHLFISSFKVKDRRTKFVIYFLGIICGIGFLFANVRSLKDIANQLILPREYGDLYYGNYLDRFKVEIPRKKAFQGTPLNSSMEKAGLILFGDSFSNYRYFKGVPELLIDSLQTDIHFAHHRFDGQPLSYLSKNNYSGEAKFLIFQTIERALPGRLKKNPIPKEKKGNNKQSYLSKIKKFLPSNAKKVYSYLIQDGKFTHKPYSFIMNKRYEWFGYISTPEVYDEKTGMLFSDRTTVEQSTKSFYYQFSDKEIDTYCDNLLTLKNELKAKHNIYFIFFPIPNKYTLYHHLLNEDEYNGLLPRLNECLEEKGVPFVDVYSVFKESNELLYYKTDTHWNEKGAQFATNLLMQKIKEIQKTTN